VASEIDWIRAIPPAKLDETHESTSLASTAAVNLAKA